MLRILTLTALAVALFGPTSHAQSPPREATPGRNDQDASSGTPATSNGQTSALDAAVSDVLFAEAAAISGMAELTISQIGVQQARDPELKSFSQKMIDDHTKLAEELTSLAAQKGIALPRMVDPRAQFCAQSLQGTSREKFDACYAKAQLTAHMEAVAAFEAESERGLDPEMKALAAKALPILKGHLHMIKPIAMKYAKEKMEKDDHLSQ
ncbi:DUF4142 domain-containing protein [Paludisphaera mucosa]|uniref:DUF4142 domain-containing protein n=1 Tax=Paludisphaera mucosa TaxID=3030827 RepID=A0ABT6FDL5_9BACT|nr:DUF4142 domain-containing protein [Paludisphaera mucosa]MDG3005569.1 DUF4142 domain-containing protein [Paludisphaera mucosa]